MLYGKGIYIEHFNTLTHSVYLLKFRIINCMMKFLSTWVSGEFVTSVLWTEILISLFQNDGERRSISLFQERRILSVLNVHLLQARFILLTSVFGTPPPLNKWHYTSASGVTSPSKKKSGKTDEFYCRNVYVSPLLHKIAAVGTPELTERGTSDHIISQFLR